MKKETILIALGGNALLQAHQKGDYSTQLTNVRESAKSLATLVEAGYQLVLSHGNGPQVGNLLLQNEEAAHVVPPFPMDVLNAQTQGFIGYMIVQCLEQELRARGIQAPVVNLLTRVVVNPEDPRFQNPAKPVGAFYTQAQAKQLTQGKGWVMKEDSGRGWRRVVPSPLPVEVVELAPLKTLVQSGAIVIAGGGGGIPVSRSESGACVGTEAVIDKDLCSCILAKQLGVDCFMILTDINNACLHYGTPNQAAIGRVRAKELQGYVEEGHFAAGSMGPKIDAVLDFTASTGKPSYICSLAQAKDALSGSSGTVVLP